MLNTIIIVLIVLAIVGFGVVRFAGGAKGTPLQVVAVVSSVLGIVIGKYISYAYFFKQAVSDRFDVDISYFDSEIFRACREIQPSSRGELELQLAVHGFLRADASFCHSVSTAPLQDTEHSTVRLPAVACRLKPASGCRPVSEVACPARRLPQNVHALSIRGEGA